MRRVFIIVLFLASIACSAIAAGPPVALDTWAEIFTALDSVAPSDPISVKSQGAVGDGVVLLGCSMTAASAVLNCTDGAFVAGDVSKVIAVYDAGPTTNGFLQPLSTTIVSRQSATQVTLTVAATTSVTNSERVIYGTNDTAALQAVVDAVADAGGGVVYFPKGVYLGSINLPCAKVGTWIQGTCTRTYNNISIRGAGRDASQLENWDVAVSATYQGVIHMGKAAEITALEAGNDRLKNIIIADLTVRQVKNPTNVRQVIVGQQTYNVQVFNTRGIGPSHECYIMGGGAKSQRWVVHNNDMGPCGQGGPAYANNTSALNIQGEDWLVHSNVVRESGQGVEMGARRGVLLNNKLIGTPGISVLAVNVGNTSPGIWDNLIQGNLIKDYPGGVIVTNSLGTASTTRIIGNEFINSSVNINSGLETNSLQEGIAVTHVHETSIVKGNHFFYDTRPSNFPIQIGEGGNAQAGKESVVVSDNLITFTKQYLIGTSGGTHDNEECTADAFGGSCRLPVGVIALAGPYGGVAVNGYLPTVIFSNNTVRAPNGAVSSGTDVSFQNSTDTARLKINNFFANYTIIP